MMADSISMVDETYPVLSKGWSCKFKISLSGSNQTISISHGTPEDPDFVGGDDQLLGSVTLECDSYITDPTLNTSYVSDSHFKHFKFDEAT